MKHTPPIHPSLRRRADSEQRFIVHSSGHPSASPLRDSLVRLDLCTERDFHRCRRRVRRLARGIPVFDFVWIDALLQGGILTPFQAKVLESAPPESLCVGPCILLERLGRGELSDTYRARPRGGSDTVVLKRLRLPAGELAPTLDRLKSCVERLRGLDCPFVVGPHFADEREGELIVLSAEVAGPEIRDLLIRRGRFPADVVGELARQLAGGLAALEGRGCRHGQLRLANVRMTASGQATLVDAAIGEALETGLRIRDDVPPDEYEGTAPELIGTGELPSTASEMYAFGCLLWQLLAGRPPFPTGDPLAKLAAHRSKPVPDVRDVAPDTPAPLAEAIRAFTEPDPRQRPANFAEVSRRFGSPSKPGERRLAKFRRSFDSAAPLVRAPDEPVSRFPVAAALTILFVLSGATLTLLDAGATSRLLRLQSGVSTFLKGERASDGQKTPTGSDRRRQATSASNDGLQALPAPNADGIIVLGAGPYEAESISIVGDLTLRGATGSQPVIVVCDEPFKIVCRKFTMERVLLRHRRETGRTPDLPSAGAVSLLSVRSQDVRLERCAFLSELETHVNAAVVWTAADARDPDAGHLRLTNCLFSNAGPAVECASPPGRLEAENCLKLGGQLFALREWPALGDFSLSARHVTLRGASSLLSAAGMHAKRNAELHARLDECVFDLAGPRTGAGLVRLTSPRPIVGHRLPLVVSGNGSVIRPNVPIVAWQEPGSSRAVAVDVASAVLDRITVGDFQFQGKNTLLPRDSAIDIRSLQIPRRSDDAPGINSQELPIAR